MSLDYMDSEQIVGSTFSPYIYFLSPTVLNTLQHFTNHDEQVGYVYALCTQLGAYRYVGQTTNPIRRYQEHRECRSNIGTYGQLWLKQLIQHQHDLKMVLIEVCSHTELDAREQYHIQTFGQHYRLHNIGTPYHDYLFRYADLMQTRKKAAAGNTVTNSGDQQSKLMEQINAELTRLEQSIQHLI